MNVCSYARKAQGHSYRGCSGSSCTQALVLKGTIGLALVVGPHRYRSGSCLGLDVIYGANGVQAGGPWLYIRSCLCYCPVINEILYNDLSSNVISQCITAAGAGHCNRTWFLSFAGCCPILYILSRQSWASKSNQSSLSNIRRPSGAEHFFFFIDMLLGDRARLVIKQRLLNQTFTGWYGMKYQAPSVKDTVKVTSDLQQAVLIVKDIFFSSYLKETGRLSGHVLCGKCLHSPQNNNSGTFFY